ncbi:MAG: membrane protein insertase YidC [Clostridiales bacterium]|nr:membrane protein insertase YidC [Clostridiales bacterium]
MSLGNMISTLLIGPLKLIFEVIFSLVNRMGNPGVSIVALSLAMNLLVLPLYRRADAIQDEERETEERLSHWVEHIRKTFTGDQRFMILQTYYRQNHYSPMNALRGALPLLLEIPFFIAAYQFLSGLELLRRRSFGPIPDLGAPDGMLTIAGIAINVLPILMTVINLISSAIYTRGAPLKSKIQLYVMALVFLVFLYDSPAGLTMYWTLNNLFSLVKNLFIRSSSAKKGLQISCSAAGFLLLILGMIKASSAKLKIVCMLAALLLQLPMVMHLIKSRNIVRTPAFLEKKPQPAMFFLSAALLTCMTGLLIPSAVLSSSPAEFLNPALLLNPTWYVVSACLYAAGTFIVWMGVFYLLGSPKMKNGMEILTWVLAGVLLINYMAFRPNKGTMNSVLQYDSVPAFSLGQRLLNLGILGIIALVLVFLFIKKEALVRAVCIAGVVAMTGMSVMNTAKSQGEIRDSMAIMAKSQDKTVQIPLSRTEKNVVVMMLDRAISSFLPCIFYEKPELKEKFEGFVYYPDTVSHGAHTNFGAPGLFGGYEYTPIEMNAKSDRLLKDKHNEALLVMPTLFSRENYTITVIDPPYCGNYRWIPDFGIFDSLPDTHCFIADGNYDSTTSAEGQQKLRMRNFFCYALCESVPTLLYGPLYNAGYYNMAGAFPGAQVRESMSVARGIDADFLSAYNVMVKLNDFTTVTDSGKGTFLMMASNISHRFHLLLEPEYIPVEYLDNTEYDLAHADRFSAGPRFLDAMNEDGLTHYECNMATIQLIAAWLDELRKLDVYDNTRIIFVADHGWNLMEMKDLILPDGEDVMNYNPLLLVKDFGAEGEIRTDNRFMTSADVPTLALEGIIDHPVNPFTGKPIDGEASKKENQYISMSHDWNVISNEGYSFLPAAFYTVHGDIFEISNWKDVGMH